MPVFSVGLCLGDDRSQDWLRLIRQLHLLLSEKHLALVTHALYQLVHVVKCAHLELPSETVHKLHLVQRRAQFSDRAHILCADAPRINPWHLYLKGFLYSGRYSGLCWDLDSHDQSEKTTLH